MPNVDFKLFLAIKEAATAAVMSTTQPTPPTTTQDNEEIVVLILGTWLSQLKEKTSLFMIPPHLEPLLSMTSQ